MKHEWNEALAAFDRELPLLKALRAEYDAYLRERYDLAASRVRQELGGRAEVSVSAEDEEWGMGFGLLGPLAEARLDFRLWPAAGHGGETGRLLWGVYLARQREEGFPPLAGLVSRAREASAALATESIASAPADVLDAGDAECIRWGSLDIAAPDLAERIAQRLRGALPAVESAAEAVLALRVTTSRSWLETILREVKAEGVVAASASVVRFASWTQGMSLNIRLSSTDSCWFLLCDDGRLAFQWESPAIERASRQELVPAALGPCAAFNENKWPGVVLIEAEEGARRQREGDRAGIRTLILDVLEKYRRTRGAE